MDNNNLKSILEKLYNKSISIDDALGHLKDLPFQDLGFAKIDHHRALRKGYPEVIFCQSKTPVQVVAIANAQIEHGATVYGTRASDDVFELVQKEIPSVEIDHLARVFWHKSPSWKIAEKVHGEILICSAGTADLSVAREAQRTIEIIGHQCKVLSDVGVSGIHRLFAHKELLQNAPVIIVIAGMEGALPSVIGGFVSCPVIAVPTSVGYGSHLNGLVPMFAMLNSCASGMTVVNIDNGFGAACAAVAINRVGL
ncbi:MAG: nickel pincer cofactor biosynthesis protein LarB [Fibrobacterota bacterium]|nr:nickel pincer cofactor biosynthesis protein LarB [Chitinispirillaceae bacterium]